jgi:hypothetical protein
MTNSIVFNIEKSKTNNDFIWLTYNDLITSVYKSENCGQIQFSKIDDTFIAYVSLPLHIYKFLTDNKICECLKIKHQNNMFITCQFKLTFKSLLTIL